MSEHSALPPGIPALINDRYEVQSLIGRGGMADVYLGTDRVLSRKVAIKLLRPDTARDSMVVTRFEREARAVAGLSHPNIVAVYDTGVIEAEGQRAEDLPYIVMEYVTGQTLRQLLKDEDLQPQFAVDVMHGVCQALEHSHAKNVVHRDIKPANVMVTEDGHVKLMDFGIARAVNDASATMTQTAAVVGTAQYLSPEQARGEIVDHRTDIYSAGCLLYELLVHKPPFTGDSPVSVAYQHVGEDPVPPSQANPDVPQIYDAVVLKALSKERDSRFASAGALASALDDAYQGIPYRDATQDTSSQQTVALYQDAPTSSYAPLQTSHAAHPATDEHPVFATRQQHRDNTSKTRSNRGMLWLISIIAVLAVVFAGFMVFRMIQMEQERNAPVQIPAVANMSEDDAYAQLTALNFTVQVEHEFSDEVDQNLATRTDPAEGVSIPPESLIRLYISDGSEQRTIPESLANQTEVAAREALRAAGLEVGEVTRENHPSIPTDWVVKTTPEMGSKVKAGTKVDLVLSTGKVTVPGVLELTLEEATEKLEAEDLGLKVQYSYEESDDAEPGTVIRQSSGPNEDVAQGSIIQLLVASEPVQPSPSPTEEESESPEEPTTPPSAEDEGDADED
ncbi:Stk1 family PASTA domain-containing Ser/Thr kinase [Glutamicibacter sp. MNS18]|uniref:Stk1 family PASTA domain-containing Ser/Thr kinase n=1 Tax=Glutamicibacter sp. MNS18 TaxID=2989817 RepID=UPI0022364A5C|nr:Stk1 family PASTA domain-containing Ser/Thr kinase [Glutamicibacter sp. MNS18]MCW4466652.1 Stk1 family PASTA domain-containing Ser/Thr kinase [Glutamicibacter sp. MNS18]